MPQAGRATELPAPEHPVRADQSEQRTVLGAVLCLAYPLDESRDFSELLREIDETDGLRPEGEANCAWEVIDEGSSGGRSSSRGRSLRRSAASLLRSDEQRE